MDTILSTLKMNSASRPSNLNGVHRGNGVLYDPAPVSPLSLLSRPVSQPPSHPVSPAPESLSLPELATRPLWCYPDSQTALAPANSPPPLLGFTSRNRIIPASPPLTAAFVEHSASAWRWQSLRKSRRWRQHAANRGHSGPTRADSAGQPEEGGRRMERGGWRMEDGGWEPGGPEGGGDGDGSGRTVAERGRMEDGGWRMEDGGWRMEG